MKGHVVISKATIDRLPLYYRTLKMIEQEGLEIISSEELGRRIGVTPEQIRKDLAAFGEFGKKGVGYYIRELIKNVGEILGFDRTWKVAIIGVGHLGMALANFRKFAAQGFEVVAMFDSDPKKIGEKVRGISIYDIKNLDEIIEQENIHIGIITVPAEFAQDVADRLISAGINGIWNFAPVSLKVTDSIRLVNEDLSIGLSSISYYLTRTVPEEK